jgi:hypothetical protein
MLHRAHVLPLAATLAAAVPATAPAAAPSCPRGGFAVGAAAVDVTPRPPAGRTLGEVRLGGYGFGAVRPATWVRDRLYARAVVVRCARGDRRRAVAFAAIDNQGMQVAYRTGPYGLLDIRRRAGRATGIPAGAIVAATIHSHAGPDLIGAWGFVPRWYLAQVRDGAVAAIRRAARTARPALLSAGSADGRALLHTQFDDPSIGSLDDPDAAVRVLRATDARGRGIATLVAFAAHATVMGARNTGASPDWPGALASRLERDRRRWGTVAVFQGTIGKTQPTVPDPPAAIAARPTMRRPADPLDADGWKLRAYSASVAARVAAADRAAQPIVDRHLGARTTVLRSAVTNRVLLGLVASGTVPRAGAPWVQGDRVATPLASVRIGDVLVSGSPGESYPAVANRLIRRVRARQHLLLGLADDQLGYHIAPASQYAVAEREAALRGNDNTLFNISPRIGDQITQRLLEGAARVGFRVARE